MIKKCSDKSVAFVLAVFLVILIFVHVFVITSRISYEMEYYTDEAVEGYDFEESYIFHKNNKVTIENSNYEGPQEPA